MYRTSGIRARRITVLAIFSTVAIIGSLLAFASLAFSATGQNGQAQTFSQVNCTAKVGNSTINQKQDITVYATAPDSVAQGETFSVAFPTLTAELPSSAQGLTINNYKNLSTKYQVNGATVVVGSGTTDDTATINGSHTASQNTVSGNNISPTIPGPIPPGTLVNANYGAQIAAPMSDTTITISAVEVDTTANVNGVGDVPVTCPVPANTLTTTQVGAGGGTTTSTAATTSSTSGGSTSTSMSTTTTTIPGGGGGNALQCTIAGTVTLKPGVTGAGGTATKASNVKVTVQGTMTGCHGGPPGLKAPVTNGTFKANGMIKVKKGAALPTCATLQHNSIAMKSSSKLKSSTGKVVTTLAANVNFGPVSSSSPITVDVAGPVKTKGAFKGQPLLAHLVTAQDASAFANTCNSSGGLTVMRFANPSAFSVNGSGTGGSTTTSTEATTTTVEPTTTTLATTTTTAATTTTTMSTTTTTMNPVPPEVAAVITTACNTLATTLTPFGVDVTPLTLGCQAAVTGQGSFLLQLFIANPQLACAALAGQPVANNPIVGAGCLAFATAIQPYSTIVAGLIPQ